jgi:hypothetical protein
LNAAKTLRLTGWFFLACSGLFFLVCGFLLVNAFVPPGTVGGLHIETKRKDFLWSHFHATGGGEFRVTESDRLDVMPVGDVWPAFASKEPGVPSDTIIKERTEPETGPGVMNLEIRVPAIEFKGSDPVFIQGYATMNGYVAESVADFRFRWQYVWGVQSANFSLKLYPSEWRRRSLIRLAASAACLLAALLVLGVGYRKEIGAALRKCPYCKKDRGRIPFGPFHTRCPHCGATIRGVASLNLP